MHRFVSAAAVPDLMLMVTLEFKRVQTPAGDLTQTIIEIICSLSAFKTPTVKMQVFVEHFHIVGRTAARFSDLVTQSNSIWLLSHKQVLSFSLLCTEVKPHTCLHNSFAKTLDNVNKCQL